MTKFNVGDIVEVVGRTKRTYGKITKFTDRRKNALVHFEQPRHEKVRGVCDSCGWPMMLSRNGGTGEIVCMRSGCGYQYGFETSDEIIAVARLVNITAKMQEDLRKDIIQKINVVLCDGRSMKVISQTEKAKILDILRK